MHETYLPICDVVASTEPSSDDILDYSAPPPIHRIPPEILGEIFIRYLNVEHVKGEVKSVDGRLTLKYFPVPLISTHPDFRKTPVRLSHVCRHWRDVTLSMPKIWSSIAIYEPMDRKNVVSTLKLWLERSRECPLSLYLSQYPRETPEDLEVLDEILDLLISQFHRWKEIDFELQNPRPPIMNLPKRLDGILDSVVLEIRRWDYATADQLWRTFHSCASLRQVTWDTCYLLKGLPSHIPWRQLLHITITRNMPEQTIIAALRRCPDVETLKLSYIYGPSISCEPLLLSKLRTLKLTTNPNLMLDHLTLPSLEYLHLAHRRFTPNLPRNSQSLNNLFLRSSCRLRRFCFTDYDIGEEEFAQYLALPSLASIVDLEINGHLSDKTSNFLSHRRVEGPTKPFFPSVETLSIGMFATSVEALADMIISRVSSERPDASTSNPLLVANLKSVVVILKRRPEQDVALLKSITRDGLVMTLWNF